MQNSKSCFNSPTTIVSTSVSDRGCSDGPPYPFYQHRPLQSSSRSSLCFDDIVVDEFSNESAEIALLAEPIASMGDKLLHLRAAMGDSVLWERFIRIDDEDDICDASQDLAAETGRSLNEVEQTLAQIIVEQRSKWQKEQASAQDDFLAGVVDSASFARAKYVRKWHVEGLLVRGQPAIIGGPHKSLKTSLVLDLAISLSTGLPFLDKFTIPNPDRVLVLSGESGDATLQETALRVCRAKNIELKDCDIHWNFQVPQLTSDADMTRLQQYVRDNDIKVVIIDPL